MLQRDNLIWKEMEIALVSEIYLTVDFQISLTYSPFLHYRLVSSLEIINIGNTGNQNHPDLKVSVVLVTCFSNFDFW